MVSWPTKRFLLFYVTWCHFVYFTFWVTYQPISLPPHDNKNLFPPHWFQHQDTHFSSLFTPSQHWLNLRVSDEIFVLFLLLRALELSVLKVYLQFYHRPCFLSCSLTDKKMLSKTVMHFLTFTLIFRHIMAVPFENGDFVLSAKQATHINDWHVDMEKAPTASKFYLK